MLQGKIAGAVVVPTSGRPGDGVSIRVRGIGSIRGNVEPLWVIDGVVGASSADLNPNDIESISILKDGSATALYGSRGANGVIQVTTKRATSGPSQIDLSVKFGVSQLQKGNLEMMSGAEYYDYVRTAYENAGTLDAQGWLQPYLRNRNFDWWDLATQNALTQNYNIGYRYGNEKIKAYLSADYYSEEGTIKGFDYDRFTIRSNTDYVVNDRLTLKSKISASYKETNNQEYSLAHTSYTPWDTPWDSQGNLKDGTQGVPTAADAPTANPDDYWYSDGGSNFLYDRALNWGKTRSNGLDLGLGLDFKIIDGLTFESNNRVGFSNNYSNSYVDPNSRSGAGTSGSYYDGQSNTRSIYTSQLLRFLKTFGEKHEINAYLGYDYDEYRYWDLSATAYKIFQGAEIINAGADDPTASGTKSESKNAAIYLNVNYSFDSKYLIQGMVRRDGSSAFGENNRWATFPSVSAAWRITEEQFMKNQHVFEDLKLRVGYGISGNSLGFDAFIARPLYGATGWFTYVNSDGSTSNYRMLGATRNANPDLKWESTSMFNIGIDFGFLHNRLSGTIEYYDKRTSDLIYDYPVSTNRYPYGTMTANVGDISNKGIEITINAVPVQTHNFTWSTTLNLSHNKNVVEKLTNASYSVPYIDMSDPDVGGFSGQNVQRIMEGSPIGQFYTYEWAGYNENGVSVFNDYDADGKLIGTTDAPTDEDRHKTGSAQPKLTYGWNNDFTWKNWTLTAFFQGVAGNQIYNATRNYYNNVGLVAAGKNVLSEVATEQKFSDSNAQRPSDRYLENGSYFRLATLTLGYNFGKLGDWVNNLRIYATCNNVFTITGYKGLDPEVYLGGLTPGMDWRNTQYPRTRTFMVGVNVNF